MTKHWIDKFRNALRGVHLGIVGQSSFSVHLPMAGLVLIVATVLRCSVIQLAVLLLCIALVMSLELMNSAVEYLARGLCREHNPEVGKALDIASAAVLVAAMLSAVIGLTIFGYQLRLLLS